MPTFIKLTKNQYVPENDPVWLNVKHITKMEIGGNEKNIYTIVSVLTKNVVYTVNETPNEIIEMIRKIKNQ